MTKNRSICKRCHRLRAVDGARYCTGCETGLRADEKARPQPPSIPLDDASAAGAATPDLGATVVETAPVHAVDVAAGLRLQG